MTREEFSANHDPEHPAPGSLKRAKIYLLSCFNKVPRRADAEVTLGLSAARMGGDGPSWMLTVLMPLQGGKKEWLKGNRRIEGNAGAFIACEPERITLLFPQEAALEYGGDALEQALLDLLDHFGVPHLTPVAL